MDKTRPPLPSAIDCPNQPRRKIAYLDEDPLGSRENWSDADRERYAADVRKLSQDEADRKWAYKRTQAQEQAKAQNHVRRISRLCKEAASDTAYELGPCDVCQGSGLVDSAKVEPGEKVGRCLWRLGEEGTIQVWACLCAERLLPAAPERPAPTPIEQFFIT